MGENETVWFTRDEQIFIKVYRFIKIHYKFFVGLILGLIVGVLV